MLKKTLVFFIILIVFVSSSVNAFAVDETLPTIDFEETTPPTTQSTTPAPVTQPETLAPTTQPETLAPTTQIQTDPPTQEQTQPQTQQPTQETTTSGGFLNGLLEQPEEPETSEDSIPQETRAVSTTAYVINGVLLWIVIVVGVLVTLGILGITFKRKKSK